MKYFYHYTLRKNVDNIMKTGIWSTDHPVFTPTEYYDRVRAGRELGVQGHYIDCVLRFTDDGKFRRHPDVDNSRGELRGGIQYSHSGKPKPVGVRNINSRDWEDLG